MATQPKSGAPEFSWLRHATELQAIAVEDSDEYKLANAMLWNVDLEYFDVADFCTTEPHNPDAITEADLLSGDHVEKFKQAARQALFYRLCEEV